MPDKVTINDNEFAYEIAILGKDGESYKLLYDNISEMCIYNDLTTGKVRLEMTYTDMNFETVTPAVETSCSLLRISFEPPEEQTSDLGKIEGNFIIDTIAPKSYETEFILYQISSTLYESELLEKNAAISTGANLRSPEELVKDLFVKAELKIDTGKMSIASGTIPYISHTNASVREQLWMLLNWATAQQKGVFFYGYSLQQNIHKIFTFNEEILDGATGLIYVLPIPGAFPSNPHNMIHNIKSAKKYAASSAFSLYDELIRNSYDHLNRKWTKTKKKFDDYYKSLLFDNYEPSFELQTVQKSKFANTSFQGVDDSEFGRRIRELALFSDSIEIEVIGDFRLEAGSLLAIDVKSQQLYKKFGGVWLVVSVYHWFRKQRYVTSMILSRPTRPKIGPTQEVTA